ncbi:TATA box-binding protein-associated factor RNA polymerase I subunit B isoform X2 [Mangifera indica]|nr:TATA box-binding protein-associated factor RNA polymerase I subunit B isoform X2 [Mangifera indica]
MATGAGTGTALYQTSHTRHVAKSRPANQFVPLSQQSTFWSPLFEVPKSTTNDNNNTVGSQNICKVKREEVCYEDGVGPTEPEDFGLGSDLGEIQAGYEDYHFEVRMKYVMGVQLMIQLQCEALVEKFSVCPLICGVAGSIWLRFLASTGVLHEDWADKAINESESQKQGECEDFTPRAKYRQEPHNLHGQRAVMIWFRLLRRKIPLSCPLAISFLACHVAREAVLPTDIVKWSIEGKLPYFAAFVEIEKRYGQPSVACSISTSHMFRPSKAVPVQKLESLAASIAESIGLHLPPINFYAITSRYLKKLSLPVEKILPYALRIQEWSMPPDLWLSTNELRLPSRACLMSILIVAIRILYNINGFGAWERSLSSRNVSCSASTPGEKLNPKCHFQRRDVEDDSVSPSNTFDDSGAQFGKSPQLKEPELDAEELLYNLDARYDDVFDTPEYSKDLPTYLQYCKDVVFAGLEPPHDDHEETRMIEQFWSFYQLEKESEPADDIGMRFDSVINQKRTRDDSSLNTHFKENKRTRDIGCNVMPADHYGTFLGDDNSQKDLTDNNSLQSSPDPNSETNDEALAERAIRRLKLDMEENRFCYIPPRVKLKRLDYLYYVRKKDEGAFMYAAHADYYILLRACARVAQVDIRIMHFGVLSFERRLAWLENRIDHCLHLSPPSVTCEFCSDVVEVAGDDPNCTIADVPIELSTLNI